MEGVESVSATLRKMSRPLPSLDAFLTTPLAASSLLASRCEHRESNQQVFDTIQTLHQTLLTHNWEDITRKKERLRGYAEAANAMGSKAWVVAGNNWIADECRSFFKLGRALKRYKRRRNALKRKRDEEGASNDKEKEKEGEDDGSDADIDTSEDVLDGRDIRLCDVGSCYNPFAALPGFNVTALDLYPMTPSVFECDFLALEIEAKEKEREKGVDFADKEETDELVERADEPANRRLTRLPAESFEAVSMSLVLNYLPTPAMRGDMVRKARDLLIATSEGKRRPHLSGLLLIAEKESAFSPPAKLMPGNTIVNIWVDRISAIGFELLTHQVLSNSGRNSHVFAFRRVELTTAEDGRGSKKTATALELPLRQDFVLAAEANLSSDSTEKGSC